MLKIFNKENKEIGIVGEATPLLDSLGEELFVGDIVRYNNTKSWTYFKLSIVCKSDGIAYIKGISDDWTEGEYGSVIMKTKKWQVDKIENYSHRHHTEHLFGVSIMEQAETQIKEEVNIVREFKDRLDDIVLASSICASSDNCRECPFFDNNKFDIICESIPAEGGEYPAEKDACLNVLLNYLCYGADEDEED